MGRRDEDEGEICGKMKEGNSTKGDGERHDGLKWLEIEGELKEGTVRERGRARWRETVFNYSALPAFSIYGPFRTASRNHICTYCRHRRLP